MVERHLTRDVRNIALAGHTGSGKTSLVEAILHVAGCSNRQGRVDDGSATLDFDPDEVKRRHSIHLALANCGWNGRHLHWVDTPGHPDFAGDFAAALRVVDDVLLVTPASTNADTLDHGLESAWETARASGKVEAVFVNKMDKERADFLGVVEALRHRFGMHVVPAVLPIGAGEDFAGVVDLVTLKAWVGFGRDVRQVEIPEDMNEAVQIWRRVLIEVAAEGDDELIEEFLEGKELTEAEIERGIHEDLLGGRIVPVYCGSATRAIGIQPLLNHITLEFESPDEAQAVVGRHPQTGTVETRCADPAAPFSAVVFKTIADPYVGKLTYFRVQSGVLRSDTSVLNSSRGEMERIGALSALRGKQTEPVAEAVAGDLVAVLKLGATTTGDTLCDPARPIVYDPIHFPAPTFGLAAAARTRADEDKLSSALARVSEADPAFQYRRDPETGETLLLGQGEAHLEVIVGRLARFGATVDTTAPRVPYRETVAGTARAQGRHKKQSGGRGQFGDCWLTVEPLPSGAGFEFVDKIVGGSIPRQYLPAIEKGVREAMGRGIAAGNPVVDIRVTVDDGSFHTVDSSEAAFIQAGVLGFMNAAKMTGAAILEPILKVEVTAPDTVAGDLMSDFSSRRGHVVGMEPADKPGHTTVRAHVPQAEMRRYAVDLRQIARGRGHFCASLSHYDALPPHLAAGLIAEHERRRAAGTGHE
jgi:elongation factor G